MLRVGGERGRAVVGSLAAPRGRLAAGVRGWDWARWCCGERCVGMVVTARAGGVRVAVAFPGRAEVRAAGVEVWGAVLARSAPIS